MEFKNKTHTNFNDRNEKKTEKQEVFHFSKLEECESDLE